MRMPARSVGAAWLVALALALPSGASAQNLKIGVVDLRKAVFSSDEGKAAQKEYAKVEEEKLAQLKPRRESLQQLEEEYENQKYVLSPEALQERRLEIAKRRRDLERDMNELDDELQIKQVQLLQPIQKKIVRVVTELGKEEGFTLILDKTAQGLVYAPDSLDVTDLVIQRLNKN